MELGIFFTVTFFVLIVGLYIFIHKSHQEFQSLHLGDKIYIGKLSMHYDDFYAKYDEDDVEIIVQVDRVDINGHDILNRIHTNTGKIFTERDYRHGEFGILKQ